MAVNRTPLKIFQVFYLGQTKLPNSVNLDHQATNSLLTLKALKWKDALFKVFL